MHGDDADAPDAEDGRQWYGELESFPAILSPKTRATTTVRVPNEVIVEYTGEDVLDGDPLVAVASAGTIASATVRHAGYRPTRVLGIEGDRDGVDVDLEVAGEVI